MKFEATRFGPAYEYHGTRARDWYAAQAKALEHLEALKAKLRGEGFTAQRGDEPI